MFNKQFLAKVLIAGLLFPGIPTVSTAEEVSEASTQAPVEVVVPDPTPQLTPEQEIVVENTTPTDEQSSPTVPEESSAPQPETPATTEEVVTSSPTTEEPEVVVAASTPDLTQQTDNPQEASSTPLLQGASDGGQDAVPPSEVTASTTIEIATTTDEVIVDQPPVDESATTTEETSEQLPPVEETVPEETVVEPIPEAEQVPPVDVPQPEPNQTPEPVVDVPRPMQISQEELIPDPDFVFSVNTGKRLNAKRMVKKEQLVGKKIVTTEVEEEITSVPTVTADNVDGVMNISGACNDKYYTVLLFKNADDYERDRRAFVINKAYPCEGGSFNYELSDLPPTLKDGTYYLMIGSQGDTSPWVPITALTEVTINNNRGE